METKNISKEEILNTSFYKLPKFLFTEDFNKMSTEAKVLYSILADRADLSIKNKWLDDNNDVYIIFTIDEIMDILNYGNQKINKLKKELTKYGLIKEKRQGLNKPNLIYIRNIDSRRKCENHISRNVKITNQEMLKSQTTKTYYSETYFNNKTSSGKNDDDVSKNKIFSKEKKERIKLSQQEIEYLNIYRVNFKEKYKATLTKNYAEELFTKTGKENLEFYLENYQKFLDTATKEIKDISRFFNYVVTNKIPLPVSKSTDNRPIQATNYEQREYDEDYYNSLYDNVTFIKTNEKG